jgi:glycosyltransferase involved in cell wall biosynthesis
MTDPVVLGPVPAGGDSRDRVLPSRVMRACLLSQSRIADDPRVRRQGDALAAAGWDVIAVGFGGARSAAPAWPIVEAAVPGEPGLLRRVARAGWLIAGGRAAVAPWVHRTALFHGFYAASENLPSADLYIANDWPMLPIAAALARRWRGTYIYDSHELATAEYADSRKWRLVNLPYLRAIEARYFGGAAAILTVSPGIADALHRLYGPAEPPSVIRNMPSFRDVAHHAVDPKRISVLYHGIVASGRGLEALIASVPAWRPEFRLTIRGPVAPDYATHLRGLAAASGCESRIELAPPVRPDQLIEEAAKADVGVVAMPGGTLNAQLALPNKFFEYVMAGLALCVTDLPEMTALVRRFDLGRLMASNEAAAIAAGMNGFSRAAIEQHRANALRAARELNWQQESQRLVEICRRALRKSQ